MNLQNRGIVIGTGGLLVASLAAGSVLLRAQAVPTARAENPPGQPPIDFARDIQPIFEQVLRRVSRADQGAGAAAAARAGFIRRGGQSGPAVTPGKSDSSLLIRRVLGLDGEDQMPLERRSAARRRDRACCARGSIRARRCRRARLGAAEAGERTTSDPEHWAYVKPDAAGAAGRGTTVLGAQSDRPLRARAPRARTALAVAGGGRSRRCFGA